MQNHATLFELDVLDELESFHKNIVQLRKSYPALYDLKKEFFDNVLNRKKEPYLLDTYYKKLKNTRNSFLKCLKSMMTKRSYSNYNPTSALNQRLVATTHVPAEAAKNTKNAAANDEEED